MFLVQSSGHRPRELQFKKTRRRAREAEGDGLENRYTRNGIRGSNPLASAQILIKPYKTL